jgi:hypothetical protein
MYRKGNRRAATIAIVGLLAISAFATPASARPASHYLDWAQVPGNAAGVVFHPNGDLFDIWDNRRGDSEYTVVYYNYKGVRDRWKEAGVVKDGVKSTRLRHNLVEHRHIYFYIALWQHDPAGQPEQVLTSDISEYRTT